MRRTFEHRCERGSKLSGAILNELDRALGLAEQPEDAADAVDVPELRYAADACKLSVRRAVNFCLRGPR